MLYFDKYLSLGGACRTRHQLDRFFHSQYQGYQPTTGFFDWLWGGGAEGVIRALSGRLLLDADKLGVKDIGGTKQVFDASTDLCFLHDFTFSTQGIANMEIAVNEMKDQLGRFLEKYRYLGEKTASLLEQESSICLVYHGVMTSDEISRLFQVLDEEYKSKAFLLNVVPIAGDVQVGAPTRRSDRMISIEINDEAARGTPKEWMGVDQNWSEALSSFHLNNLSRKMD